MTQPDPLAGRRIDTEQIRRRLAESRQEGATRQELSALQADALNLLKNELRAMTGDFAKAKRGLDADTLVSDACVALSRVEGLWEAEPSTVLGAVMTAAQLGLRIGVLGQSFLLPFWSRQDGVQKAQLVIGYQGYVQLCYSGGRVVDMASEIVYQKEADAGKFRFHRTEDRPHLFHEPDISIDSRDSCPLCHELNPDCENLNNHGELIHGFYAQARVKGGGFNVTRPWGLKMMLSHRARYTKKDRNGRPPWFWTHNFPAAGRKTMARELTRLLPKTTDLANALYADEGVRSTWSPRTQPGDATEHETYDTMTSDAESGEAAAESLAQTMEQQTMHPLDRDQ